MTTLSCVARITRWSSGMRLVEVAWTKMASVDKAAADGEDEQVPANAVRGRRTEQRELLADRRVGVDGVFDVQWTGDRAIARESEDAQLAVIWRVRASGDPADHVVAFPARRRHRYEEDELGPTRAGQPRRHVIRLDGQRRAALREHLARDLPRVGPTVEIVRVGHVIERVHLRLNAERR